MDSAGSDHDRSRLVIFQVPIRILSSSPLVFLSVYFSLSLLRARFPRPSFSFSFSFPFFRARSPSNFLRACGSTCFSCTLLF